MFQGVSLPKEFKVEEIDQHVDPDPHVDPNPDVDPDPTPNNNPRVIPKTNPSSISGSTAPARASTVQSARTGDNAPVALLALTAAIAIPVVLYARRKRSQ